MKTSSPVLVRLFTKRREGVDHVGFVRQQRFYPVQGLAVSDGAEVLVKQVHEGSPSYSGEYVATLAGASVTCRQSFPI